MFQRLRAFAQMTTYLGLAVIGSIWCGVFFLMHEEHERAYEDGVRQGSNLVRVFEAYISRVLGGADSALLTLRDSYEHDPQHFNIARSLSRAQLQNNIIMQFGIDGPDGLAKLSSIRSIRSDERVSENDRDYFRFHADSRTDELYISAPSVGRVFGKLVFHLTRRLTAPDGSFGGVILATIDILELQKFYNSIDIGRGGVISLDGFDGIVRARSGRDPGAKDFVGQSTAKAKMFSLYRQSPTGTYWNFQNATPQIGGVRRLISYQVVEGFPLIAVVGLAEDDIFRQSTAMAHKYCLIALLLTASVIVAIGIGARRQRKLSSTLAALEQSKLSLERSKLSLEQTNLWFNAALKNMAHGLSMFDRNQQLVLCNERYGDMYGLTREQTKPGTTLRSILEARVAVGKSPEDADAYIEQRLQRLGRPEPFSTMNELRDGRMFAVSNQPMQDGGWVAIHQDVTELRRAEKEAQQAHTRLLEVAEAITAGIIVYDKQDRLVLRNQHCEEIYDGINYLRTPGASFEDTLRHAIAHGAFLDACGREDEWIAEQIARRARQQGTHEHLLSNGRWVRYDDRRMIDGGTISTIVDITELKHREEELKVQNTRFVATLENMAHGLCMFDKDQRLIVCNERYSDMYGLTRDQIKPGITLRSILEARVAVGASPEHADAYVEQRLQQAGSPEPFYAVNELRDGRIFAVSHQPMSDGGCVAIHQDITAQKRAETQIAHMARHDGLTGIANRTVMLEKMEEALASLRRRGDAFTIFMLDLDQFKTINDSLGHPVGDELLKALAARLSACMRETDTVARLGGDEFAILATADGDQREAAIVTANRLLEAGAAPYELDGHHIDIGVSIGIAFAPEHGTVVDQLMKSADLALYKAKADGRNTYRFFEDAMGADARTRHALQIDLRSALTNNEFELHYHPIVDIKTRKMASIEALVRWRHPQRGMIAPGDFIPLAEETGLINPIGEWVLRKACSDAVSWPPHIKVSVNLSPVQFRKASPVDIFCNALSDSGLPPERLELEITESVLLHGNAENVEMLHQLRLMGISIVLDDFGTGYSSLSYLRMFPFDKIKIDRSFVNELSKNADCASIVSAVAGLGRSLGIGTVAEGIETEDHLVLVHAAGCTHAQGFLFGRPCPAAELNFGNFSSASRKAKRASNRLR